MNLVYVLAGRAAVADAIVAGVHGLDVIPAARELAGVEMSLVGELGRERFLGDALESVLDDYEHVVIDTPPNLGLLTRWQPRRISSRETEDGLIGEGLAPLSRIPSRSALIARAATRRVPLALSAPDSSRRPPTRISRRRSGR